MDVSRASEPAYAGVGTFAKLPLALTPDALAGYDVAIVGAPFDEGVANRPGARFGPRAIRAAEFGHFSPPERPNLALGIDAFEHLKVVDYGDAECPFTELARSHDEISRRVAEIYTAGAIPVVLGGDHSVAYPTIAAAAARCGARQVGIIQFDAHADTGDPSEGNPINHGTPIRRLVQDGKINGRDIIQVGLRGYWPGEREFSWMRSEGFRWHTAYDVQEKGIESVVDTVLTEAGNLPDAIYLSVDIDCLDPAFAPGTGVPEPGGLTSRELLYALRRISSQLPIVGLEVVEVSPPYDPSGITAVAATRCILEVLSGVALRRSARQANPQQPAPVRT